MTENPDNDAVTENPDTHWSAIPEKYESKTRIRMRAATAKRDEDGHAVSPNGDRIHDLRQKVAGWHFSQEALTPGERAILYVAEQILGELDRIAGGYYQ